MYKEKDQPQGAAPTLKYSIEVVFKTLTSDWSATGQGRGNRESGGEMTPARKFTWGQTWYFDTQTFGKIFSGTHPHGIYIIILLQSEGRFRSVFLLSLITHLWTPRNVAFMI